MPMKGRSISSSVTPSARRSERCGARAAPSLISSLLTVTIAFLRRSVASAGGQPPTGRPRTTTGRGRVRTTASRAAMPDAAVRAQPLDGIVTPCVGGPRAGDHAGGATLIGLGQSRGLDDAAYDGRLAPAAMLSGPAQGREASASSPRSTWQRVMQREARHRRADAQVILGACNPVARAPARCSSNRDIGLLLPCNVVVYDTGAGTRVAADQRQGLCWTWSSTEQLSDVARRGAGPAGTRVAVGRSDEQRDDT